MNIVLIGYMASGKTTVGKMLQDKISLNCVDLDALIEQKEGRTINEIFAQKGEIYFRKVEREILMELLERDNLIISLGGGTPCYYNNMEEINKHAISFYLRASVNTLVERLKIFGVNRPLVKNRTEEELQEYVAKHIFERNVFYEKANHIIATDHKSFEEVTYEIMNKLS